MRCPGIWLNIILDLSVMLFLGEINILIRRLSKADCTNTGGPYAVSEGLNRTKKAE